MSTVDLEQEFSDLKEVLQCPICLDTFTRPVKILSCLHSFCSGCLASVLETSASSDSLKDLAAGELPPSLQLRCPICRRVNFGFSRIESLEDNVFAHRQLDRLAELDKQLGGYDYNGEEEEENNGEEDGEKKLSSSSSSGAPVITDATKQKRKKLLDLIEEVSRREESINKSLAEALEMEEKVAENVCEQLYLVTDTFEQFERKLLDRKAVLTGELTRVSNYKLEKLGQQRKQLERDLEGIRNTVAVAKSLNSASDDVFLQLEQRYIEHLNRLNADPSFEAPPREKNGVNVSLPARFDFLPVFGQISDKRNPVGVIGKEGMKNPMKNPTSVTISPVHEQVIIANTDNNSVDIYDLKGNHVRAITAAHGATLTNPRAVFFDDSTQSIFVVDKVSTAIRVFDISGKFLRTINRERLMGSTDSDVISSIAVYPETGNIVLCDTTNHRIQIVDPAGANILSFGVKGSDERCFDSPSAIALDFSSGNIYVCDSGNNRISIYDREGNLKFQFGRKGTNPGEFDKPVGIAVDPITLSIAVTEPSRCRIQIFDKNGLYIYNFGSKGKAEGYFASPGGLAFDGRGTLYILDSTRIQLF